MSGNKQTERVNWLSASLTAQSSNISNLLSRLKGIALRIGTSLSLHKKFLRLMDQVAADREKELDIINEIEAVEKHHHELRKLNLLHRAKQAAERRHSLLLKKKREDDETCDWEERPRRSSWLFYMLLIWLMITDKDSFSKLARLKFANDPMPSRKAEKLEPEIR